MSSSRPTIDPDRIPAHFDAAAAERRWDEAWERAGLYRWDASHGRGRGETFVVDTPPPTVSGSLHMGHTFSYTHPDVIVRQRRMRGQNVFYPMGWDDNGLPTERRVQNYFHVRCDPALPYEPGLALEPWTRPEAERKRTPPRTVFVGELRALIAQATASFDALDFAAALQETERLFWARFTDAYLELAKLRAREGDPAGRASAVATLRLALDVLLRLFAPFLPYITEEIWSWAFAGERGQPSIHRAPWPTTLELAAVAPPEDPGLLQVSIDALAAINKGKSERSAAAGRTVERLELRAAPAAAARLRPALADVMASARIRAHALVEAPGGEGFEVIAMELTPKDAAPERGA